VGSIGDPVEVSMAGSVAPDSGIGIGDASSFKGLHPTRISKRIPVNINIDIDFFIMANST
jgi:hypothetical protein